MLSTQDRPDLIQSELSGLAFSSCQQLFRSAHLDVMFSQPPPEPELNEHVYMFIDPAGGGPQSDYAMLSITRHKGLITVSPPRALQGPVALLRGPHVVVGRESEHGEHAHVCARSQNPRLLLFARTRPRTAHTRSPKPALAFIRSNARS